MIHMTRLGYWARQKCMGWTSWAYAECKILITAGLSCGWHCTMQSSDELATNSNILLAPLSCTVTGMSKTRVLCGFLGINFIIAELCGLVMCL